MRVATAPRQDRSNAAPHDMEATRASLAELLMGALEFTPPQKTAALAGSWFEHRGGGQDVTDDLYVLALGLASAVALFTPSLTGTTAFDRLAKARKPASPAAAAALTALRATRLRLLRIDAVASPHITCADLASGDTVRILDEAIEHDAIGAAFVAFVAPLPGAAQADGLHVVVSGSVSLDQAALDIAMRHVHPGRKGLLQPLKCAEAVYRHVVRHGGSYVRGIDAPPSDEPAEEEISGLHMIALAWSLSGSTRDPEDIQAIRQEANLDAVVAMLESVVDTRRARLPELAEAFEAIVLVMLETVQRRAAVGSGTTRVETIEAELEARIRAGNTPAEARKVFRNLRQRLGATSRPAAPDTEQEKLVARIQALRAKTVEQGCTEQEAMAAAAKVAELLDRYGLTLGETELREQTCDSSALETGRKRMAPIDQCVPTTASFFDCRVWAERRSDGVLRYIYFGLPADVAAARYLYDLIDAAFRSETARFQERPLYVEAQGAQRRKATESFQVGLGRGIVAKLEQIKAERDAARTSGGGRDLVVVKEEVLDRELEALGLNLRKAKPRRARTIMPGAFHEGHQAGLEFEYTPGIGQDGHRG